MSLAKDLREGLRAARAGRTREARIAFLAVLRQDPTNETALIWLGYLANDPRASLAYVSQAVEAHPQSPRAHRALQWAWRGVVDSSPGQSATQGVAISPPVSLRHRWRAWQVAALTVVGVLLLLATLAGWRAGLPVRASSLPVVTFASPSPSPMSAVASPPPFPTPMPAAPPLYPPSAQTATPLPSPTVTSLPPASLFTPLSPTPIPAPLSPSEISEARWIDVDLSQQMLTAYEGNTPVRVVTISTGLRHTPTPVGQFRIWTKLRYDAMSGPGYYLPDVPYTMYFHAGYALHGTYWHDDFGQPMSHGCINLPTPEAQWLFDWAEVGTLVNIHE